MPRRTFWTVLAAGLLMACGSTQDATNPTDAVVTQVTVTLSSSTLSALGDTVQASAQAKNAAGDVISSASIAWTSSNPAVATVSSTGRVAAVSNGTATITATAATAQGNATVTVSQTVASIAIAPATLTFVSIDDTASLHADPQDSRGNSVPDATVTWSTADSTIVSLYSTCEGGVPNVICLKARGSGTVAVTASVSGTSTARNVTVSQRIYQIFTSSDALSFDALGDTADVGAFAADSNRYPIVGATLTWASSDTNVATVDQNGHVVSTGNGTASITVSASSRVDTVAVTVLQAAASIDLTCASNADLTYVGETRQCSADILDRLNHTMAGTVTWSVDYTSIASIDQTGLLTAVDNGTAHITAAYDTVSASESQTVLLQLAWGDLRTGTVPPTSLTQYWQINSDGTTRGLVLWSRRNPPATGSLDPLIKFESSNLPNADRLGATGGYVANGAQLLAIAPYANTVTSQEWELGDNNTTGGYTVALTDCWVGPALTSGMGYYDAIGVSSCAVLNGSGATATPKLTGAELWPLDLTGGNQVTITVVPGCTPLAAANGCTGLGGNLDPVIYLFAPDNSLAFDDDSAAGDIDAYLSYVPPVTGRYTAVVTTYGSDQTGIYSICIYANCSTTAPPPGGGRVPAPVTRPGWSSHLTVDEAYARLKALGVVAKDFDPRTARPPKPQLK